MKDLIAKLKTANYKKFVVDHGEKVGVGVIGLFLALILWMTNWKPYDKTPEQLETLVRDRGKVISQGIWPQDEDKKYPERSGLQEAEVKLLLSSDPEDRLNSTQTMLAKFQFSTEFIWPINRDKLLVREPEWLSIEDMIAGIGRVVIPVLTPQDNPLLAAVMEAVKAVEPSETDPRFDKFANRSAQARSPFGGGGGGGEEGMGGGGEEGMGGGFNQGGPGAGQQFGRGRSRRGRRNQQGPNSQATVLRAFMTEPDKRSAAQKELVEQYAKQITSMGASRYGPGTGQQLRLSLGKDGRAMRFVAIRGVVPLQRQIKQVALAINEPSTINASPYVEYLNFKIERRIAQGDPATNGWSDWEPVDFQSAIDVLEQALNFDFDILDVGVTDPVFTMPLPMRVVGFWDKVASHPRLEKFELSEDDVERQYELYKDFIDQEKLEEEHFLETSKGGFNDVQVNMRSIRSRYMTDDSLQGKTFLEQLQSFDGDKQLKEQVVKEIKEWEGASGRLLLFRYFDFDVLPGRTYQYRAKLVLWNPNEGLAASEVVDNEVRTGFTRDTPMSEPTPPVYIPEDVKFFVKRVQGPGGSSSPSAMLDVFQWSTKVGTVINKELRVSFAQHIGGTRRTLVLDPVVPAFEQRSNVEFRAEDVLVDVSDAPRSFSSDAHSDLDLPAKKLKSGVGVFEQALVVNRFGDLVAHNPALNFQAYETAKIDLERERGPFLHIKEMGARSQLNATTNSGDGDDGGGGGNTYDSRVGFPGQDMGPRLGSPIRKRLPRRMLRGGGFGGGDMD